MIGPNGFVTVDKPTVASLLAELPRTIRVGLFDMRLETWTPTQAMSARRFGEFSAIEQRITLQAEMGSTHKLADTLLHELLHALFWVWDMGDGEKEEHVVGHLSTAMLQVYRDNPWLLGWIRKALHL